MEYRELTEQLLNSIYEFGKHKAAKTIGSNLKGETFTLMYLQLKGAEVSPGELVNVMEISSARVAALLNSLEKKELISRKIDPADRRKIVVKLTEKGQEKADNCRECSNRMVRAMLEWIGEEDARHLLRICRKVTEYVAEMPLIEEDKDVIED